MAELQDGNWLTQFVDPQLLLDFQNYNDSFIGVLKRPNQAAIHTDGIRFNKLINNVGFHVNTDKDFTPKKMEGKKGLVEWDKLDTDPTEVTDAELRAMAYDKESAVRQAHFDAFKIGVRDYAMHKLAPNAHVAGKMPILRTTGANFEGRKRLTYADLLQYYITLETLNLNNPSAWYMLLCDHHRADLLVDKSATSNHRDIEIDKNTGQIKRFFKLQFFENNASVIYDTSGTKKDLGATIGAGDQKGSVFFYAPNTVYHIEDVMTLYKPLKTDTRGKDPKSEIRLHTYGLCDKRQEYGFGALVSDNASN